MLRYLDHIFFDSSISFVVTWRHCDYKANNSTNYTQKSTFHWFSHCRFDSPSFLSVICHLNSNWPCRLGGTTGIIDDKMVYVYLFFNTSREIGRNKLSSKCSYLCRKYVHYLYYFNIYYPPAGIANHSRRYIYYNIPRPRMSWMIVPIFLEIGTCCVKFVMKHLLSS